MSMVAALAVHNFRLLLLGSFGSNIGTWMQRLAQDWLVLELTSSPAALGITSGLQFLPALLATPFGGVLADRYPKRRIVVLTQCAMAICSLLLAALAITGVVQLWHVFILVFVFGTASALDLPARTSLVSDLVDAPRLPNAVSWNSLSLHLGRLVGPAMAGGLIALLGSGVQSTGWVILVNGISYAGVVLAVVRIDPARMIGEPRDSAIPSSLRSGVRYLLSRPDLVTVTAIMFMANLAGLNFQVIIALMARVEFGAGAGEFGIMSTALALGSILGALVASRRVEVRVGRILVWAAAFGVVMAGASILPDRTWFTVYLALCGFFALQLTTSANAYLQLTSDSAYRGRVMALHLATFLGASAVGAPVLGFAAEHWGPRVVILAAGVITVLSATVGFLAGNSGGRWRTIDRPNREKKESSMLRTDFDGRALRDTFATFPTGVVALCADVAGQRCGMVASSFVAVSVDPALVGVFIQRGSATWERLQDAPHLGVSVLAAGQRGHVGTMSSKTGDRFTDIAVFRDDTDAVFIEGAASWMEATVHSVTAAGDHELVLLEVRRLVAFDEIDPVVFHRSALATVRP